MKARFTNIDIVAAVQELQANLVGLRVTNVYDVDHKSYLFKFAKPESKVVLLIESGIRIHTTDYEWPKNASPSGFSMKLRKHIRNRRLEEIKQVGVDRIVDMKFGSREAAYHVILELYDRGNIILTDHEYNVLNILRPRTDQDTDVRYVVHEKYPMEVAKQWTELPGEEEVRTWFSEVKTKEQLKKVLASHLFFGAALVEHGLLSAGLTGSQKVAKDSNIEPLIPKVIDALKVAEAIYKDASRVTSKGYIVCKEQPAITTAEQQPIIYDEFHSFRFAQLKDAQVIEKPSFLNAVDEFFSNIEKQRVDVSIMEQQKLALKKLENVHRDHERRLDALRRTQDKERLQALLIEQNVDLVDKIIVYMRTLMAAKLTWPDVAELLERRRERGDEVAEHVLKADIANNSVTILLENRRYEGSDDDEEDDETKDDIIRVDIDLSQSAFQNVSRLHTVKKQAAAKEMKTVEASEMALKNAEKKTKQALKDVATIGTITKARKTHWFEKFFWFISSEKLLVIGGRDAQQNEMLVKKYLKTHDFYVHADLHGASSVIVKNPTGEAPPPKTLNEAAVMAIAYSNSWEAKVPSRAWWVFSHQVSKTAPSGEYLGTGSFMIRGKKNFLPPLTMVYGFGFIFRIDDESVKNRESQATDGKDPESAGNEADIGDDEDVVLELDDNDDDAGVAPVEGAPKIDAQPSYPDTEDNDGGFLKSLVSKVIRSGGDAEENTVIGATPSGYTPKAPTQKLKPAEVIPDKAARPDNAGKNNVKPNHQKQKNAEAEKEPLNSDEEDWANYKKKGKKNSRPSSKSYAQKHEGHQGHQGLPAKPAKKSKKGAKEELVKSDDTADPQDEKPEVPETDGPQIEVVDFEVQPDEPVKNEQPEDSVQDGAKENLDEDDDEDVAAPLLEDVQTLRSLVGNPLLNDNILYGIPVCAPYVAMQDYKIKVKLLPGTTKRGKAAKACFQVFLKEKGLTASERDVLKSVKDQDLSRNFPGSVKIAVQQQKFKQKKK